MVITSRDTGPVDTLDHRSGVLEVVMQRTQTHMVITSVGHTRLTVHSIHNMEAISNKWVHEVALALVGSKDHPPACMGCLNTVVVMIIMEDKRAIIQIPPDLPNILARFLHMLLALIPTLRWAPHNPKQITIMDSIRVQITGIQHLIHNQLILNKATVMDTMIMLQHSITMGVLSHTRTVLLLQVMGNSSRASMVSHHMACHHRVRLPNLMALPDLVNNPVMCLIKALRLHNHMVRVCHLSSHIHMHLVDRPSRHILHMDPLQLPRGTTSHHQQLAQVILSKEASQLQVTASPVCSRLQGTNKWFLLQRTGNTRRRSKAMLSSRLQPLQVTGIKHPKILHTGLHLHQLMVHHQPRRQVMLLNLHKLSKVMISQHNRLVLMVFNQVLQLLTEKLSHLSLVTLNTTRPRYTPHRIKYGLH